MLRPLAVQAIDAVVRCGICQLIIAFVAVLNDETDGLMGSLDVGGESRSFIFGIGHNASACFELCPAEPLPRECGRMRERLAVSATLRFGACTVAATIGRWRGAQDRGLVTIR